MNTFTVSTYERVLTFTHDALDQYNREPGYERCCHVIRYGNTEPVQCYARATFLSQNDLLCCGIHFKKWPHSNLHTRSEVRPTLFSIPSSSHN